MSAAQIKRRDAAVITLIAAAHFLSHFYILCIPPMFPMMRAELGLSYAALGAITAVLSAVTALGQTPIGVWVDRRGAAPWLIGGTALMALGTAGLGLAPGWAVLLVAAIVSGLGNATIHPCDYAILAGSIDQRRMGRAFSLHTAAGYAGFAAAPPLMIALEAWLGWRGALIAVGLAGLPCTVAIAAFAGILRSESKRRHEAPSTRAVLGSRPILLLFAFMALLAMGASGVQTFMVAAMPLIHGVSVAAAAAALTGWLIASTVGTLAGGWIADRSRNLVGVVAAMMFSCAALVVLLGVVPMGELAVIAAAALAGFCLGVVMPSRDLLVRQAAPAGTTGQVFGFVSAGLPLGGALAPAPMGLLMDLGAPSAVFLASAALLAAAVLTAGSARAAAVAPAAAE
ncbi:MFS transporter [Elioraea tepidiphila]|jgi:predicted MFS family arabinose efflux permease|uniref:MFS transporter n=1 Tax=Elioraea tepidiphila TaxID=457934 RepID=UPI002FDB9674